MMSVNSGHNDSQNQARIDIIIGVPICRRSSFVLDLFLANQEDIQNVYPNSKLVLATEEEDFVDELKDLVRRYKVKSEIITYEVNRPEYGKSRVHNIASGREALRLYALSVNSDYLLFMDADMVFQPDVINVLKEETKRYDAIWSGYNMGSDWGFGAGCVMLRSRVLRRINFRCYEFRNGELIQEDEVLDMDLFRHRMKTKKGIFVHIRHYQDKSQYISITPQSTGWFRKIANCLVIRYILVKASLVVKYNLPRHLYQWRIRRKVKTRENPSG